MGLSPRLLILNVVASDELSSLADRSDQRVPTEFLWVKGDKGRHRSSSPFVDRNCRDASNIQIEHGPS